MQDSYKKKMFGNGWVVKRKKIYTYIKIIKEHEVTILLLVVWSRKKVSFFQHEIQNNLPHTNDVKIGKMRLRTLIKMGNLKLK